MRQQITIQLQRASKADLMDIADRKELAGKLCKLIASSRKPAVILQVEFSAIVSDHLLSPTPEERGKLRLYFSVAQGASFDDIALRWAGLSEGVRIFEASISAQTGLFQSIEVQLPLEYVKLYFDEAGNVSDGPEHHAMMAKAALDHFLQKASIPLIKETKGPFLN